LNSVFAHVIVALLCDPAVSERSIEQAVGSLSEAAPDRHK
jgi:hypothetical protein